MENGRARLVSGHDGCTATRGKACQKANLALQQLYDKDRVLKPLKRTNPVKGRGSDPGFTPITWDEALDVIAERIVETRAHGTPEACLFLKGRSSGVGGVLYNLLPELVGTPNHFGHSTICAQPEKEAAGFLCGWYTYRDYDLAQCKCLLLWSADPLCSNRQQVSAAASWGSVMENACVVCIDPRFSVTAAKADIWLPIIPGTDGALACAIAHAILVEGVWNKGYVGDFREETVRGAGGTARRPRAFSAGIAVDETSFLDAHSHGVVKWWNLVLKDTTPEWAARICGIDAADITRVARQFAACAPASCSWVAPGTSNQPNGIYGAMAAEALNGLVGSVGCAGGPQRPVDLALSPWPDHVPYCDALARAALRRPTCDQRDSPQFGAISSGKPGNVAVINNLPDVLLAQDSHKIEFLMSSYCNFAFSCSGTQRWERLLASVPFHVCITANLSETAMFADIVLPAKHHMLESWGVVTGFQGGSGYVALEQPVVATCGEAKAEETEFTWALAKRLAEKGFDNVYRFFSEAFVDLETGKHPGSEAEFAQAVVKWRTSKYWNDPRLFDGRTPAQRWQAFKRAGVANVERVTGWGQGTHLETPTGTYEFYSEALKNALDTKARACGMTVDALMELWGYEARGDMAFVPHFEQPVRYGDPEEFPFIFSEHRSRLSCEGRSANTRLFQQLKGADPGDEAWDDVLKINSSDMEKLGLANGDVIRVTSEQGSITVRAKSWEGTRPGVVVKCYGQGHWAFGSVAALDFDTALPRGGNNNEILPCAYDRITAQTARHGGFARVKIERLGIRETR